jgi:hypothetical protein
MFKFSFQKLEKASGLKWEWILSIFFFKFLQLFQSSLFDSPFSSFPFLSPPKSMTKKEIYPHVTWEKPLSFETYWDNFDEFSGLKTLIGTISMNFSVCKFILKRFFWVFGMNIHIWMIFFDLNINIISVLIGFSVCEFIPKWFFWVFRYEYSYLNNLF